MLEVSVGVIHSFLLARYIEQGQFNSFGVRRSRLLVGRKNHILLLSGQRYLVLILEQVGHKLEVNRYSVSTFGLSMDLGPRLLLDLSDERRPPVAKARFDIA